DERAKQNAPARDDLGASGWVLDLLSFFFTDRNLPGVVTALSVDIVVVPTANSAMGITEGAVTLPEASTSKSCPALSPPPVSCSLNARAVVIFLCESDLVRQPQLQHFFLHPHFANRSVRATQAIASVHEAAHA